MNAVIDHNPCVGVNTRGVDTLVRMPGNLGEYQARGELRSRTSCASSAVTALDRRGSVSNQRPPLFSDHSDNDFYVGVSDWMEIVGRSNAVLVAGVGNVKLPQTVALYLPKIYLLERSQQSRRASRLVMKVIESNFARSDLAAVNSLVEWIDFDRLSVISISALFRCSSRARINLPAWRSAFQRARLHLRAKGEDVDSLFAGLAR